MAYHRQEICYETDALIIGAGSAGLWAAHSIKKKNKNIRQKCQDSSDSSKCTINNKGDHPVGGTRSLQP